jgi:glycosyltransferase involved in cell wall biosynthesis
VITTVYYTSTFFLDLSLDIINVLKKQVNLHVLIEISPASKNANIVDIETLPEGQPLVAPELMLTKEAYANIKPYLDGVASVNFVVHTHTTGLSFSTLKVLRAVKKFIRKQQPQVLQFEGFTLRSLGLATLFFSIKQLYFAVHDAVLHTGESGWKTILPRFVYLHTPVKKTFVFYSQFSLNQFVAHTKHSKAQKLLTPMCAFSYFNTIANGIPSTHQHILFFGRISKYKGVNVLINAMPQVLASFSNEQLVIAGKGADEPILTNTNLLNNKNNITLIDKYIPNNELVKLIAAAKFIVCPYIDASQSGVLMTAFALNKPVVASDVGAFGEAIVENENGLLVPANDEKKLADGMLKMLTNDYYKKLENNIFNANQQNGWQKSMAVLTADYLNNSAK